MIRVPEGVELGKHFTYGACDPAVWNSGGYINLMFSIGVYRAVLRESGKGLKASRCVVRVKGYVAQPEAVREKAEEIRSLIDAGRYTGHSKFVRVPWVPGLPDAKKGKS